MTPGPYRATSYWESELTLDHIHTFLTTQGQGGTPRMRDQPNGGANSETTWTWKTIHTIHALSHSNKVNMKGWLWQRNDIRGPCGPKASWHLSYGWGKSPIKTWPRKLAPTGIEPGPAAWQACMLTCCTTVDKRRLMKKIKYVCSPGSTVHDKNKRLFY